MGGESGEGHVAGDRTSAAGGGAIYGLGIFGAWVYYFQEADGFWWYVLAFFEGIFWPAFVVYHGLDALGA
jgi:hypothetical protein